jgi:hypothetical protein
MKKISLYLISFLIVLSSFGQSREELERKRKEIQDEITQLQKSQNEIQKE